MKMLEKYLPCLLYTSYYEGEPLFPFGFGLSYTGFSYCSAKTDKISYQHGDTVTVTLDIENVGIMDGDEVVQLYAAPSGIPMTVPKKQLRAFTRIHVPRGEKVTAKLSFPVSDLSYWNINKNDFDLFSGNYKMCRRDSYKMGAKRVVLAREVGLEDIREIRRRIPADMEIETFVHGAMCVSFS